MDDVPGESGECSELKWPSSEHEVDDLLWRASANIRWLRVWGHLRMRPPTVSRDQALVLAQEVAETMSQEVNDVFSLAELTAMGSRTPCIYNVDLSDCWIAYLAPLREGLGPSEVVVIDKKTGAVRYIGSANDEG